MHSKEEISPNVAAAAAAPQGKYAGFKEKYLQSAASPSFSPSLQSAAAFFQPTPGNVDEEQKQAALANSM